MRETNHTKERTERRPEWIRELFTTYEKMAEAYQKLVSCLVQQIEELSTARASSWHIKEREKNRVANLVCTFTLTNREPEMKSEFPGYWRGETITPENVTKGDIGYAARLCMDAFQKVVGKLSLERSEEIQMGVLRSAWEDYYFQEFARFDTLLKAHADQRATDYGGFLPLSISHHNLHRLFEVLELEIGDRPLATTRVPERVRDLFEICHRLDKLLAETCS